MFNILKAAAAGIAFTAALLLSGGLILLAPLVWETWAE